MKLIYTHENRLLVSNVQNILENAGIAVVLKNEFAGGGSGDLSFLSTWLEIWVLNEEDFDRAMQVVSETLGKNDNAEWICNNCQEHNSVTFDICWNCQEENIT